MGEVAAPGLRDPDHAQPARHGRATRWRCCPSAHTGRRSWSTTGEPVGVITEADCLGVDRFTQVRDVMTTEMVTLQRRRGARARRSTSWPAPGTGSPRRSTTTACSSACSPAPVRCAPRSTRRRSTTPGGSGSRAAIGVNGDVEGQGGAAGRDRRRLPRRRHRPRPPGADGRGARRRPLRRGRRAGRRRQRRLRRRGPRPGRGRRRHRQGRRRPRRDVHHPDDDRRRTSAVQRRARVRRRGQPSTASTSGPTGECATRATSRWPSPPAPPR